jgi:hypothetical protein
MKRILQAAQLYRTPYAVQKMILNIPYNAEKNGETIFSAEKALEEKTCHCLEAVFIAAAILEQHGYEPLILSLESHDLLDHVVFLFQQNKRWGAIGRSRDRGLHGRAPVFKSISSLVRSYFAPFVDKTGRIISYQVFHLDETQSDWRSSSRHLWSVEQYLGLQKHIPIHFEDSYYMRLKSRYDKVGPLKQRKNWW